MKKAKTKRPIVPLIKRVGTIRERMREHALFGFAVEDFNSDLDRAGVLVEVMMTFLDLDAEYDAARLRSANSPTSQDLFDRANMAATARNEARTAVLELIKTTYPQVKTKLPKRK